MKRNKPGVFDHLVGAQSLRLSKPIVVPVRQMDEYPVSNLSLLDILNADGNDQQPPILYMIDGIHTRRITDPDDAEVIDAVQCPSCGAPEGAPCLPPKSELHHERLDYFDYIDQQAMILHDIRVRRESILRSRAAGMTVVCAGAPCGVCDRCAPEVKGAP